MTSGAPPSNAARYLARLGVTALVLATGHAAFADDDVAKGPVLGHVTVEGATGAITGEELARKVGMELGAALRVDQVRSAIHALYAIGAFRSVEALIRPWPAGGVELVFRVLDRLILSEIVVSGAKALAKDEVVRAARMPLESEIDVAVGERAADRIHDAYVLRGYNDVEVHTSLAPMVDPTRVRLVVEIKEGPPTLIERVIFTGRPVVSAATLLRALPSGLHPHRPLDVTLFREAREALRSDLRLRAYYDADIKTPTYDIDRTRHTAVLTIAVDAGPQYVLDFVGNAVVSDVALTELVERADRPGFAAPLKSADKDPGSVDDHLREELERKVKRRYQELGFLLVDVRLVSKFLEPGERVATGHPSGSPALPGPPSAPLHLDDDALASWRDEPASTIREPAPDTVKVLRFTIDEGKPVKLLPGPEGIAFVGNDHIEGGRLRNQILAYVSEKLRIADAAADSRAKRVDDADTSGRGPVYAPERPKLTPVETRDVYVPELFDEAAKTILDVYRAEGYWDTAVEPPDIAIDPDAGFVSITITIEEGDRQILREVLFDGAASVDSKTLVKASRLALDKPLDPLALEEARLRLLDLYAENGFLLADVDYEVARLDTSTSIAVFRVAEGPRSVVESIEVRGLDRTARSVVVSRLKFDVGDYVKPSALRESERALRVLGIFTAASVAPEDPESPDATKKIIVTVAEDLPGTFEPKIGYSTDDGPRARVILSYANLFGLAWNVSALVQANYPLWGFLPLIDPDSISPAWPTAPFTCRDPETRALHYCPPSRLADFDAIERRASIGLRIPQLFTLFVPFDLTGELIHSRRTELAFGLTELGARLTAATSLVGEFQLRVETDILNDTYVTYSNDALSALPRNLVPQLFPDARITLFSVRPTLTLDYRDNPFNPTRGLLATLKVDYVVSLADGKSPEDGILRPPITVHALRTDIVLRGYIPLGWPRNAVLAVSFAMGSVLPILRGEAIPPDRGFFLGGRNSMRAYYEQEMLPADIVHNYEPCLLTEPTCNRDEELLRLRTPARLYGLHRVELRFPLFRTGFDVALFGDLGNSWANLDSIFRIADTLVPVFNYGFAIRYPTPIGPISLEFGFNPAPRTKEVPGEAEKIVIDRRWAVHFSIGVF